MINLIMGWKTGRKIGVRLVWLMMAGLLLSAAPGLLWAAEDIQWLSFLRRCGRC